MIRKVSTRITEEPSIRTVKGFFPDDVLCGFTTSAVFGGNPKEDCKELFKPQKYNIAFCKQPHGDGVRSVCRGGEYNCDGLITQKRGLLLVVRTADCLPLFV